MSRPATVKKRMFVKMYFDARDSGLLAALPDDLWKTLCCLATYVDENGNCYPSQAVLGEALGISRQHINYRIKRLLAFRFHGEPILTVTKSRQAERGGSRWANNVYRLGPITGLAMFDVGNNDGARGIRKELGKTSMSPKGDTELPTSMSPHAVTQSQPVCHPLCHPVGDTNQKEQGLIKTLNVNGFKNLLRKRSHQTRACQPRMRSESAASFSRCSMSAVITAREASIGWLHKRFPKN